MFLFHTEADSINTHKKQSAKECRIGKEHAFVKFLLCMLLRTRGSVKSIAVWLDVCP